MRRFGGGLPYFLAAVALAASACTNGGHRAPPAPRVLGQPEGTPLVVGQPAPSGSDLGAVSCANAFRCWAVGVIGPSTGPADPATVIAATKDGGAHWTPQAVSGSFIPQLSGVSCPDAFHCMAVGSNGASVPGSGVVFTTADGGVIWAQAAAPSGVLTVGSVVCATSSQCTVVVNDGTVMWSARSDDFGRTWQRLGNLPTGFVAAGAMSCPVGGPCLMGGYTATGPGHGQGAVALSPDGGQTWALASVPAGQGVIQDATCLTVSRCLAAGSASTTVSDLVPAHGELLRSADGGHTWLSSAAPPLDDVYGIACPSARVCAMVGANWTGNPAVATGAVAESTDGGVTFAASPSAYVPLTLSDLDCPNTARCVAAGGATVARITLMGPSAHRAARTSTSSVPAAG